MPTSVITEALPITMPTIVSKLRRRLLRSVVRAILTVSAGGIRRVIVLDAPDQSMLTDSSSELTMPTLTRSVEPEMPELVPAV